MNDCRDCRFCQPYDAHDRTPMCVAKIPRHMASFQRLPTGDCGPDGKLFEDYRPAYPGVTPDEARQ